jgi:hypothetical protein
MGIPCRTIDEVVDGDDVVVVVTPRVLSLHNSSSLTPNHQCTMLIEFA